MKSEESNLGTKLSYLLLGGGIGAILALLFAPQAGEKFRTELAEATRKGLDKTGEMASQLGEKVNSGYVNITTKATEIYDSAKQKISSETNRETPAKLKDPTPDPARKISASVVETGRE